MPVTCKKINNVYRLIDPDGIIVSSAKHDTLEACQKQAAAINIHMNEGKSFAIAFYTPDLDGFTLSKEDTSNLIFEKEVIYEGNFVKSEEQLKIPVPIARLSNWDFNIKQFIANGIKIPVPIKHTDLDNPELNRGEVIGSSVKKDSKDRLGLFLKVKFKDQEAADLTKTASVSIFSVPEFVDGKGNSYKDAIVHLALTDYPVVPDLDKFQAIAASFGELKMASVLLPIAQRMGIEGSDSMNDTGLATAILTKFDELVNELKVLKEMPHMTEEENNKKKEEEEKVSASLLSSPLALNYSKLAKENRIAKLDALVLGGHITKASRDELVKQYCSEESVKLSLSDTTFNDSFDSFIEALKKNIVVKDDSDRQKRAIALSNPANRQDNPLVADAEDRAKALKL